MKKNIKYIVIVICSVVLCACKKYPEGGKLNSYKGNLRGTWKFKNIIVNGIDILPVYDDSLTTSNLEDLKLIIEPDFETCQGCSKSSSYYEKFTMFSVVNSKTDSFNLRSDFKCNISQNKKTMLFSYRNFSKKTVLWFQEKTSFDIIKLTDKELKIKNDTHEIIFEKKSNSI